MKRKQGSWTLRYRHGGRQREVTLGNYPDMPLANTRKVATAARAKIDKGIDVAEDYLSRDCQRVVLRSDAQNLFRRSSLSVVRLTAVARYVPEPGEGDVRIFRYVRVN